MIRRGRGKAAVTFHGSGGGRDPWGDEATVVVLAFYSGCGSWRRKRQVASDGDLGSEMSRDRQFALPSPPLQFSVSMCWIAIFTFWRERNRIYPKHFRDSNPDSNAAGAVFCCILGFLVDFRDSNPVLRP